MAFVHPRKMTGPRVSKPPIHSELRPKVTDDLSRARRPSWSGISTIYFQSRYISRRRRRENKKNEEEEVEEEGKQK